MAESSERMNFLKKLAQLKLSAVPSPYVHGVHAAIAFGIVMLASLFMPKVLACASMLLIAGVIEFYFDKHFELQSFEANLHDWEDYLIGVLIAWIV